MAQQESQLIIHSESYWRRGEQIRSGAIKPDDPSDVENLTAEEAFRAARYKAVYVLGSEGFTPNQAAELIVTLERVRRGSLKS